MALSATSQRKRKWLTNEAVVSKKASVMVTISSDALKSYLPTSLNNSAAATAGVTEKSSNDAAVESSNDESSSHVPDYPSKRKIVEPGEITTTAATGADSSGPPIHQFNKQCSRTVIIEVNMHF